MKCIKRTYASAKAAKRAHRAAHWRIRTYWCSECRAWHVTNQEKA